MQQIDLAAALGLTKGQVSKLVKRGMPTGSVDEAEAWRKLYVRPEWSKGTSTPPADNGSEAPASDAESDNQSYWRAKAQREATMAELAKIDLAKARRELVAVAEVERGLHEAARMLRDMILAVPSRVAAEMVAASDAGVAQRLLREQLTAVLDQFERLAEDALHRESSS